MTDRQDAYDRLVKERVDRALAPYVEALPPDACAAFREQLEDFITTHPVMQRMLSQLLPAPAVWESGEVDRDGERRDEPTLPHRSRARSGGRR